MEWLEQRLRQGRTEITEGGVAGVLKMASRSSCLASSKVRASGACFSCLTSFCRCFHNRSNGRSTPLPVTTMSPPAAPEPRRRKKRFSAAAAATPASEDGGRGAKRRRTGVQRQVRDSLAPANAGAAGADATDEESHVCVFRSRASGGVVFDSVADSCGSRKSFSFTDPWSKEQRRWPGSWARSSLPSA